MWKTTNTWYTRLCKVVLQIHDTLVYAMLFYKYMIHSSMQCCSTNTWYTRLCNVVLSFVMFVFLAFDFCPFCMVISLFNSQWLRRISIPDFIHYYFCPILILEKEPVFPFLMLSAKLGKPALYAILNLCCFFHCFLNIILKDVFM